MKIGIFGNYGATNIGDDAILRAILSSHKEHEFIVFSADPAKTEAAFGVKSAHLFPLGWRSMLKFGIRKPVKALMSADAVILGGGGLLQDDRLYACFLWAWQIFWVKFLRKPLFIYAAGVGPLKTWLGKKLTKYVYDYASGVTVRDEISLHLLARIGVARDKIEITADPAFLSRRPEGASRCPHTILVSLRPWLKYNEKIISVFTGFLLKLKQEKNARFTFVCMQKIKEQDRAVIDRVAKAVDGIVFEPHDFEELMEAMKKAEFAIGMRFHFLIAAILTQTPALAISYGHKVDILFRRSPLEPFRIPLDEISVPLLAKKMTRLSAEYNNAKIFMRKRAEIMQESAEKNPVFFNGFIKTLTE